MRPDELSSVGRCRTATDLSNQIKHQTQHNTLVALQHYHSLYIMTNAVAEYESLFSLVDGNADNFSVKPRWQRKKEQAANAGDRFIANRGAMDSDH